MEQQANNIRVETKNKRTKKVSDTALYHTTSILRYLMIINCEYRRTDVVYKNPAIQFTAPLIPTVRIPSSQPGTACARSGYDPVVDAGHLLKVKITNLATRQYCPNDGGDQQPAGCSGSSGPFAGELKASMLTARFHQHFEKNTAMTDHQDSNSVKQMDPPSCRQDQRVGGPRP